MRELQDKNINAVGMLSFFVPGGDVDWIAIYSRYGQSGQETAALAALFSRAQATIIYVGFLCFRHILGGLHGPGDA